jgi:signal transduction histidine kinase
MEKNTTGRLFNKTDSRVGKLIQAIEQIRLGNYSAKIPVLPPDQVGKLGSALVELSKTLDTRCRELDLLNRITLRINSGFLLEELLEEVYREFHQFIPYNRIGFSLIDKEKLTVIAHWAETDQPIVRLGKGYESPLKGSSLEAIIQNGKPRILNNLLDYLNKKPESESTRLVVEEGMRSSLTCPLVANGTPVGFMFFSSIHPDAYKNIHTDIFQQIAAQLSLILEKGRLANQLTEQNVQIENQNKELKKLMELKDKFLGMAAHDLRNPISLIQMMAEMLLSEEFPPSLEEVQKFHNDIRIQSDYMLDLLRDILDVAQIESGKLALQLQRISIQEFLDTVINMHQRLAEPKGILIRLDCDAVGELIADPLRIRQVMDNLLSNAVKYSPAGSTVRVCCRRQDDHWRFEIKDSGPGIRPEDRDRLFKDFGRLSTKPTGGEKSTGLGLAISKRVVEAHHGKIGLDSEPEKGSIFWFSLPAEKNSD